MESYFLYLLARKIVRILPLNISYSVAKLIARFYYHFALSQREVIRHNLRILFSNEIDDKKISIYVVEVFKNFAKYLVDFFRLSKLDKKFIQKFAKIEGSNNLDKALNLGRGVIAITVHLGNWELGAALISCLGYPIDMVALSHNDRKIDEFFIKQRQSGKFDVIPLGKAARKCYQSILKKRIVGIAGDVVFLGKGVKIKFLNKLALVPKGPALLSIKTGAPIVPVIIVKDNGRFKLLFERHIQFNPTDNLEQDIVNLATSYMSVLGKYVIKYPTQWFMFRKFWA